MEQSPALGAFYIAYARWIKEGASQDDRDFDRRDGLCHNLVRWADHKGIQRPFVIMREMKHQFGKAGLHVIYPFNGNFNDYRNESYTEATHLNSMRILWVQEHIPREERIRLRL